MNKKKIVTLIVAASLTLGILGGTLAWFTSQDTVINSFNILGNDDGENGVEIYEKFDNTVEGEANKMLPGGTAVEKIVQVKNTAEYSQLIRVKLDPKWLEEYELNPIENMIMLNYSKDMVTTNPEENDKWVECGGYYYYLGKVAAGKFTQSLLDSVGLDFSNVKEQENDYKNTKFKIEIIADGVQADGEGNETKPADNWLMDEAKTNSFAEVLRNRLNEIAGTDTTTGNDIEIPGAEEK